MDETIILTMARTVRENMIAIVDVQVVMIISQHAASVEKALPKPMLQDNTKPCAAMYGRRICCRMLKAR